MNAEKWVPFHVREGGDDARQKYEALVEEPSLGLERAMADYVGGRLLRQDRANPVLDRERVLKVEQALEINLHPDDDSDGHPLEVVLSLPLKIRLSVIDYCLHEFLDDSEAYYAAELMSEAMLRARFAYTIDLPERRVVRVLPVGIDETVRSGFGDKVAGLDLREAVHWATGLNPDPRKSFDAMVRAIEAVAKPALAPNDNAATLGKMLGQIRGGGLKLNSALPRNSQASPQALPTAEVVRGMMELVWSGYERHGGGGAHPTVDEARALLGVAGTLVVWFGEGIVSKA